MIMALNILDTKYGKVQGVEEEGVWCLKASPMLPRLWGTCVGSPRWIPLPGKGCGFATSMVHGLCRSTTAACFSSPTPAISITWATRHTARTVCI